MNPFYSVFLIGPGLGIAIEFLVDSADETFEFGMNKQGRNLDYVGNDYRHFASFMASGFGGRPDVRRNFTCSTFGCSGSFRDSTSDGTRSGLTLRERESFC